MVRTSAFPRALVAIFVVLSVAGAALAQRRGFGGFGGRDRFQVQPNAPYDGRFTFVRVNYETAEGGYWYRGLPAWAHGYPIAEQNLMKIMNELSYLGANEEQINTLSLDDCEHRYSMWSDVVIDRLAACEVDVDCAAFQACEKSVFNSL